MYERDDRYSREEVLSTKLIESYKNARIRTRTFQSVHQSRAREKEREKESLHIFFPVSFRNCYRSKTAFKRATEPKLEDVFRAIKPRRLRPSGRRATMLQVVTKVSHRIRGIRPRLRETSE